MFVSLTTLAYTSCMKITRLGHAAVLLEGGKRIIIDPFITGNPQASTQLSDLPHVDYVVVTHDHNDHFGDALALAQRDHAVIVGIHENTIRDDVAAGDVRVEGGNIGGTIAHDGVSFSFTPAIHSASHGDPCGVVVNLEGKRVYHAGDTGLFGDMALIPKLFGPLDVALLPIGGRYTMDVAAAALAVELLAPKLVIPIHYNTWPIISADPARLKAHVQGSRVVVLDPGQSHQL